MILLKELPLLLTLALVFIFTGCTEKRAPSPPSNAYNLNISELQRELSWHLAKFRFAWPEESSEADLSIDLLVAYEVVKPIIVQYRQEIALWRFHRRAIRDQSGHQLSFIFYSSPQSARIIFRALELNPALNLAAEKGFVTNLVLGEAADGSLAEVSALSDRNWSPILQNNWPYFAMGTSSLWLGLISDTVNNKIVERGDMNEKLAEYQRVNQEISALWREEGDHALLHHLNAIFGYEPIKLRRINF